MHTDELEGLLPTEADVVFYEEHGYWVTGDVLPDNVVGAAQRGAERHWSGERDWVPPVGGTSLRGSRCMTRRSRWALSPTSTAATDGPVRSDFGRSTLAISTTSRLRRCTAGPLDSPRERSSPSSRVR